MHEADWWGLWPTCKPHRATTGLAGDVSSPVIIGKGQGGHWCTQGRTASLLRGFSAIGDGRNRTAVSSGAREVVGASREGRPMRIFVRESAGEHRGD